MVTPVGCLFWFQSNSLSCFNSSGGHSPVTAPCCHSTSKPMQLLPEHHAALWLPNSVKYLSRCLELNRSSAENLIMFNMMASEQHEYRWLRQYLCWIFNGRFRTIFKILLLFLLRDLFLAIWVENNNAENNPCWATSSACRWFLQWHFCWG